MGPNGEFLLCHDLCRQIGQAELRKSILVTSVFTAWQYLKRNVKMRILRATNKLAIDNDRMYALSDGRGSTTHNMDEVTKLAEPFYRGGTHWTQQRYS